MKMVVMDSTSFLCKGEALGDYVEALASAHRRVIKAKDRIQRCEDRRLYLLQTAQFKAAEVGAVRIRDLQVDLRRVEAVMNCVSNNVRSAFDIAVALNAPSNFSQCALTHLMAVNLD